MASHEITDASADMIHPAQAGRVLVKEFALSPIAISNVGLSRTSLYHQFFVRVKSFSAKWRNPSSSSKSGVLRYP